MVAHRLHCIDHFNHVLKTFSRRELQQCPDLSDINATLIFKGLLHCHSQTIGPKFTCGGAGRARTDDDQIMSPGL